MYCTVQNSSIDQGKNTFILHQLFLSYFVINCEQEDRLACVPKKRQLCRHYGVIYEALSYTNIELGIQYNYRKYRFTGIINSPYIYCTADSIYILVAIYCTPQQILYTVYSPHIQHSRF